MVLPPLPAPAELGTMTAACGDWSSSISPELGFQGALTRWLIPHLPRAAPCLVPPCTPETLPQLPGCSRRRSQRLCKADAVHVGPDGSREARAPAVPFARFHIHRDQQDKAPQGRKGEPATTAAISSRISAAALPSDTENNSSSCTFAIVSLPNALESCLSCKVLPGACTSGF